MSTAPQFEPLERRLLLSSSPALSSWLLTADTGFDEGYQPQLPRAER